MGAADASLDTHSGGHSHERETRKQARPRTVESSGAIQGLVRSYGSTQPVMRITNLPAAWRPVSMAVHIHVWMFLCVCKT
jgi:hypothetical protein